MSQSFDTFNTFGKTPEALDNACRAFVVVLDPWTIDEITSAFQFWLREKSVMPTPADINKICTDRATARRMAAGIRQKQEFKRRTIVQIVRDHQTKEVLCRNRGEETHLSPVALQKLYGWVDVSYLREEPD